MNRQFQAKAAGKGGGSSGALASLLTVRRVDEERAERALAQAMTARVGVEEAAGRLAEAAAKARAQLATRRKDAPSSTSSTVRAADALAQRRFLERLEARALACEAAVTVHARERLEPARRDEAEARAAHLRARTRREVVERAITRREEARRRERALAIERDDC